MVKRYNTLMRLIQCTTHKVYIPQCYWTRRYFLHHTNAASTVKILTDLPLSIGFTTNMVTIDWFFKACKLMPLMSLPNAFQVAEVQFDSLRTLSLTMAHSSSYRLCRAFMEKMCMAISHTSDYHPQFNRQVERTRAVTYKVSQRTLP